MVPMIFFWGGGPLEQKRQMHLTRKDWILFYMSSSGKLKQKGHTDEDLLGAIKPQNYVVVRWCKPVIPKKEKTSCWWW